MARTSGSSAGDAGGGRVVRRTASGSARAQTGRRAAGASAGAVEGTSEPGVDTAAHPITPSEESGPMDAQPTAAGAAGPGTGTTEAAAGAAGPTAGAAGPASARSRAGLEALAARRKPKVVPPAPGGLLPTTRRGMLRYRVLPRSVVGVSMLILAFAIGAGLSGVVLFSYYQFKQNQANDKVNALISGYKGQFAKAESDLAAAVAAAKANIDTQLKGVQALQAGPAQVAALIKQLAPSLYFVHTLDAAGQPSVGTAFVIASNSSQTLLLTSYTTVTAATRTPGPPVYVTQGDHGDQVPVTVRTWDPQYDMALLILPKGGQPVLAVAPSSPAPQPGDRLFAVSGLGTAGGSVAQGSVIDASSSGLQLDAPIGTAFQGGPLVDRAGQVVAVASQAYAPLGFTSQGTYFVPYVQAACNKVLSCPGGTLAGSH